MKLFDKFLNKHFLDNYCKLDRSLFYGKAGLAIYYSVKSKDGLQSKNCYSKVIDDLLTNTPKSLPMSIQKGKLGLYLAIDYITTHIEKKNSDIVLEYEDVYLYQNISSNFNMQDKKEILNLSVETLFYISIRLKNSLRNKTKRLIFINKSIELVERVYSEADSLFYMEQVPYSIINHKILYLDALVRLYSLGIYRDRISHLLYEISYRLRIPTLHSNKLLLLYETIKVNRVVDSVPIVWKDFQEVLYKSISMNRIYHVEMREMHISFINGISGIFLLQLLCNKENGERLFELDKEFYYNRISRSLNSIDIKREAPFSLMGLNGFWGMNLLYEQI